MLLEKPCSTCRACGLIDQPYPDQLAQKQQRMSELFADFLQPEPIIPAPQPLGYRLTAKLRVAADPLRLGIYRPGSSEVVDLSHCPVHHPLINNTINTLKLLLAQYDIHLYDLENGSGFLRGVMLRVDPLLERVGVVLVTTSRKKYHNRAWRQLLGTLNNQIKPLYLLQNYNDTSGNRFLGAQEKLHSGRAYHNFHFDGRNYTLPAAAFSQVNGRQAVRAYELVIEAVGAGRGRVAELYSGASVTGLALSSTGREVLAVEIDPECVRAAQRTAEELKLKEFHVLEGDVDQQLEALRQFEPETVIVNPPRKGLTTQLVELLPGLDCKRIVYMSCNPQTLRRDVDALAGSFALRSVQPLDMFPQTEHIEVVAVLVGWEPAGLV